jgi:hypothetical protein
VAEPTVLEWVVTSLAVLAVVAVGAAAIVLPALPRAATNACRVVAVGLAALAVSSLLTGAVLASAGSVASGIDLAAEAPDLPTGTFVDFLIDADPDATQAAGTYAPLVLGPLAALLGVLAHAVADPARTPGLRAVVGAVLGAVAVGAALVVLGDTGALATRAALGVASVAVVSAGALVVDELRLRRSLRAAAGAEQEVAW